MKQRRGEPEKQSFTQATCGRPFSVSKSTGPNWIFLLSRLFLPALPSSPVWIPLRAYSLTGIARLSRNSETRRSPLLKAFKILRSISCPTIGVSCRRGLRHVGFFRNLKGGKISARLLISPETRVKELATRMSVSIGTYFIDRDQPQLSPEDAEVVRRFHQLYYGSWLAEIADTINLSWFGHQLLKCPLDLWIYQELLVRTRPDFVVETGTYRGGSALYFAMLFDQIGRGRVITVDIQAQPNCPEHPRIRYVAGSSTDPAVVLDVQRSVIGGRVMVILDSDHHASHVYEELIAYSPLVQPDDYLIVEDT